MNRVLIMTDRLSQVGGTESWTATMANEFLRWDFAVNVFSFDSGLFAKKMQSLLKGNFSMTNSWESIPKEHDLILVNHKTCLNLLLSKGGKRGFKVLTCHGPSHFLEQPTKGADAYVAVSEEVQGRLKRLGFDSTIIRNPINTEWFQIYKKPQDEIKTVLMLTDRPGAVPPIRSLCDNKHWKLLVIGKQNPSYKLWVEMSEADVVISYGRGCYEAMACGRNVLVYDWRPYAEKPLCDGMISLENIEELWTCNCSGRRFKGQWTQRNLLTNLVEKYDASRAEAFRNFVVENLSAEKVVDSYFSLVR